MEKIFLDSSKSFIIHTLEGNFWRENMYHYSSFEGYYQLTAVFCISSPILLARNIFTCVCSFHRAMGSLSAVGTPALIYLALSILVISFYPLLLNVAIKHNVKTLLKEQPGYLPVLSGLKKKISFFLYLCPVLLSIEQTRQ